VAEIPAKKLKMGSGEKSWPGRICGRILLEVAERGRSKSSKEVLYLTVMTKTRDKEEIKYSYITDPSAERCIMFL
jgi:hypothetical protein